MPRGKKAAGGAAAPEKKKRRHKRDYSSFSSYIYKILKQVHPQVGISSKAMAIMDSFVDDMCGRIAAEAGRMAQHNKHKTMTSRDVQGAVRIIMGPMRELVKHAVSEGTKAVMSYNATQATGGPTMSVPRKVKGKGKAAKANIVFSVGRVMRRLRDGHYTDRVAETAPVFLAAVLEYLCAEVLELSGNATKEFKKTRISPRHILLAIRNDEEIDRLLGGSTRTMIGRSGGAIPHIHKALLPKEKVKAVEVRPTPPKQVSHDKWLAEVRPDLAPLLGK
jgi:histone H2A